MQSPAPDFTPAEAGAAAAAAASPAPPRTNVIMIKSGRNLSVAMPFHLAISAGHLDRRRHSQVLGLIFSVSFFRANAPERLAQFPIGAHRRMHEPTA